MDGTAYFARTVTYGRKIFIKLISVCRKATFVADFFPFLRLIMIVNVL
jgi:hypothetical protein